MPKESNAYWGLTLLHEVSLRKNPFFEKRGPLFRKEKFFKGRPMISRDTPINGGIYVGGHLKEALVVDDTKDGEVLNTIYNELISRRKKAIREGKQFKDGLLLEVWNLVGEVMPYDSDKAEGIENSSLEPDTEINISNFIGGGGCRHQALLTAYLLERLAKEGYVGGSVSFDTNYVPNKGAHAWARYENSKGEIFILDPAQGYIGALKDMNKEEDRWFYERPEDTNPRLKTIARLKRTLKKIKLFK